MSDEQIKHQAQVVTDDQLLAAGFERRYEGSNPAGFIKRLKAWDMPYVREHIIDDADVYDTTEVLVEITADRMVEMVIPTSQNASEPALGMDTPEGLGLLRDAGVKLA